MKTHEFAIVASAAGCDDATVSLQKGLTILEFDRSAKSFYHALKSAMADGAKAGAEVLRLEPDPLVSLSDIAARAGITRAAASHYANGARGKSFPTPVARVTTESPLWDWVDVARWLYRQGKLSLPDLVQARVMRSENRAIQRRRAGVEKVARADRAAA